MTQDYTITKARYSKGNLLVHCPSDNGYKTRAARLIGDGLNCRWVGRGKGYVASPAKVAKFEALYAAGFDASTFSGSIYHPDRPGETLTVAEAMKALRDEAPGKPASERAAESAVERHDPPAPITHACEAEELAAIEPDSDSPAPAEEMEALRESVRSGRPHAGERVRLLQAGYEGEVATVIPGSTVDRYALPHALIFLTDTSRHLACDPGGEGLQWERFDAIEPLPPHLGAPAMPPAEDAPQFEAGSDMEAVGTMIGELIGDLTRRVEGLEGGRDPLSMESAPPAMESQPLRRTAGRGRLIRRCVAMRQRAELDRGALLAAGDYVRSIQHQNEPAPGIVAQMLEERAKAAATIADLERRLREAVKRADALAEASEGLAGRAIRAEQALLACQPRALPAPAVETVQ